MFLFISVCKVKF